MKTGKKIIYKNAIGMLFGMLISAQLQAAPAPLIFTDENTFLTILSGFQYISDDFDSSAWNDTRSELVLGGPTSVSNNGMTWTANDSLLTSIGWGVTGYGLHDSFGNPDGLYGSVDNGLTLLGIGGWFTRTSAFTLNLSLDGGPTVATFDLSSTYQTNNDHVFYGVIDLSGFSSFSLTTPYSGGHWGLDNFTMIVQPSPVPIPAGFWLFGSGLVGLLGFARQKKHN